MFSLPLPVKRIIAYFFVFLAVTLPLHLYADEAALTAAGKQAKQFGTDLSALFLSNMASESDGTLQFGAGEGSNDIRISDLFPGTSGAGAPGDYYPEDFPTDVNELGAYHDDSDGMYDIGSATKQSLFADANSDEPTITGAAYRVLLDAAGRSRPDFSNDPILDPSKKIYEDIDLITEGFGDCSVETTIHDDHREVHSPIYKTCDRVSDDSGSCEIRHEYEGYNVSPIELASTDPGNRIEPCGIGCHQINFLDSSKNYREIHLRVVNIDTIDEISLDMAFDGRTSHNVTPEWASLAFGKNGSSLYPVPTHGRERSSTREWYDWYIPDVSADHELYMETMRRSSGRTEGTYSGSFTGSFKERVSSGDTVVIKVLVKDDELDGTEGTEHGFIRVMTDLANLETVITRDAWVPPSCVESALGVADGFAEGHFVCVDDPADSNGCTIIDGSAICSNHLAPSPLPGISNTCTRVEVEADYTFYKGESCYTDVNGDEQCFEAGAGELNGCRVYEEDASCGFISSQCAEGAMGESGKCYLFTDVFDCGSSFSVPTKKKTQEFSCGGPIKCMGDECLDITMSQSEDFAKAAALLQAAEFITQDMDCNEDTMECQVFSGTDSRCKRITAGIQDCCDTPTGVTLSEYLSLLKTANKLGTAIAQMDNAVVNNVQGAYQTLKGAAEATWETATKPFVSYAENISGAVENFATDIASQISSWVEVLKQKLASVIDDILIRLGYEGGSAAASGAAASMFDSIVQSAAGQLIGMVMTVYGWVALVIALIKLIFKCEEEEFELNAKRELRSCHYVGNYCETQVSWSHCSETIHSYCCFNSPLSRIIQEQVRDQLGVGWGKAERPECGGMPLNWLTEVDWTEINLDEWLAILAEGGQIPDGSAMTIESLTGAGTALDVTGRLDATARAHSRVEEIDVDSLRRGAAEELGGARH